MGNRMTEEEKREEEQKELDSFVNGLEEGPDLKVSKNIVMFCSLSSSDILKQHYDQRKMEAGDLAPDLIKNLVEKLGSFTPSPALAGLGALAVAFLIDIVSFSSPEDSIKEALRSVFAEEKASEVRDQIDECLKRCTMNINDKPRLIKDIERIEEQLSMALTKLKNSMVRDGHMTIPALKAWVNGAAFHIQMMIHLVRLGGNRTCHPVKNLLCVYEKDLDRLFVKHKETIEEKSTMSIGLQCPDRLATFQPMDNFSLVVEDKLYYVGSFTLHDKYVEVYYDHRYMSQKHEIQKYFRSVRENLQSLVQQTGSFKV